uniref:Putative ovule protein n=1 Tax=Solanum chacoense TaxID=4108 RepID=A0A0V0I138_SOLCH
MCQEFDVTVRLYRTIVLFMNKSKLYPCCNNIYYVISLQEYYFFYSPSKWVNLSILFAFVILVNIECK